MILLANSLRAHVAAATRRIVVDILVQGRRDQHAAEAFIRRAVGGCDYTPRVVITDKLASYPPALRRVLPSTSTGVTRG